MDCRLRTCVGLYYLYLGVVFIFRLYQASDKLKTVSKYDVICTSLCQNVLSL